MDKLLEVKNVSIEYKTEAGIMRAVDDVSFSLDVGAVSYTHLDVYKRQVSEKADSLF